MRKINISLNPTYLCNFRCNFCYLTSEQLADKNKLPLHLLEARLLELSSKGIVVDHIDLYGGEVALLGDNYLYELDSILNKYSSPTINIITNLSKVVNYFNEDYIDLSVSFDFEAREQSDRVLNNIIKLKKEIAILMLASPQLLKTDIDLMINTFNSIANITSVEIKPYSSNQANQLGISFKEYEIFIENWLRKTKDANFEFINRKQINQAIQKKNNAFSDDHIYITPNGKYSVLEFDENEDEFFLELNSIEDYFKWCDKEKNRVKKNKFCSHCDFLGHCLTEHYRTVHSLDNSCNGFINLLKMEAIK